MAVFTSNYTGAQVDEAISKIFSYSGGNSDNVRMASQIGLIPNDSTKGSANGAIIASLITAEKSLFMDKDEVYYINGSSWEIGYEFSISGKATIVCSGYMFKPVAGGSVIFDGIAFRGSGGTRLIGNNDKISYQVGTIRLTNCSFSGLERTVSFNGNDVDYNITPFGVTDLIIENCHFTELQFSQIDMVDIVVSGSYIIRNCRVDNFPYVFINAGTTNSYEHDNSEYNGDMIIEGNVVTGAVQADDYSYHCFVLAETNRLIYKNNIISNIIGTGDATYDVYASSKEVVYEGNVVKNVCSLPVNTQMPVYTEIFKAKGGGGTKTAKNNQWYFDFDECRQLVSDILHVTYTDARWSEINTVNMFGFTSPVNVVFCNNTIIIRGGRIKCAEASHPIVSMLFDSNIIDTDGAMSGYMMPIWNPDAEDIIVTNNIIKTGNTDTIKIFGVPDQFPATANNPRVICKNNCSDAPIMNISSSITSEFVYEDNTYSVIFPSWTSNITCSLAGNNKVSVTEFFISSGQNFVCNALANAITTLHCNSTSGSGTMLYMIAMSEFDMYLPESDDVYRFRNDNGTRNVYDRYGIKVATFDNSTSEILRKGNRYFTAMHTMDDGSVILYYFNETGKTDIVLSDKSLDVYPLKDNGVVGIIPVSGTTLIAQTGRYYRYDSTVTSLAVTLPAMSDTSRIQSIIISMTTGSSNSVTFTSDDSKAIAYSSGYKIEDGKSYEINCLFNGLKWVIASMEIS